MDKLIAIASLWRSRCGGGEGINVRIVFTLYASGTGKTRLPQLYQLPQLLLGS